MLNKPVFQYFDYREYLTDYYTERKSKEKGFSHRKFLQEADIPGTVYLQRVLTDQRKLSLNKVSNFSKALGHSVKEAKYFKLLVQFKNEKKPSVKEKHLRDLLVYRNSHSEHRLADKKLNFYDKWYYAVIRELLLFVDFKNDYRRLARQVIPKISPQQAENAVQFLLENGFVYQDKKGKFHQKNAVITTGPDVNSTKVVKYHKNNLLQAAEAMDNIPREDRDVSSITLSVSEDTYETIKEELRAFRKRLLTLAKEDGNPQKVCLVGMQLIPRTKTEKKLKKNITSSKGSNPKGGKR